MTVRFFPQQPGEIEIVLFTMKDGSSVDPAIVDVIEGIGKKRRSAPGHRSP
jgi:hypothetical protein